MSSKEDKLLKKLVRLEKKEKHKVRLAELQSKIISKKQRIRSLTPHRQFDKEKLKRMGKTAGKILRGLEKVGTSGKNYSDRMNKGLKKALG